jgi:methionyl-tRNA formyltransferase
MPAKPDATPALPCLSPVIGKPVVARCDGGQLSSDGGVLVLREVQPEGKARLAAADWARGARPVAGDFA